MELKALILVDAPVVDSDPPDQKAIAEVPFACLDVLGATPLERIAQHLRAAGISQISLISGAGPDGGTYLARAVEKAGVDAISATADNFWQAAEDAFEQFRQGGADLVLLLHMGPYVELDYEELIQHHIVKRCRMTTVTDPDGEGVGIFVLDAARRGDATTLFRSGLRKIRDDCERFSARGYINRLRSVAEFRRLAIDGLLAKGTLRPVGRELKPGVWVGEGTRIHRKARVLAPAYVGAYSKVRASSLVTRNSVIEHHAEVDCGTVVENSTILPYTYVGAGLDIMHSVVGFRRIWHLLRGVEVEIHDTKLVGTSVVTAVFRTAGSTAAFFVVLPKRIYRGFLGRVRKVRPAGLPESREASPTSLSNPDVNEPASGQEVGEFPANFAVVRRYGEH